MIELSKEVRIKALEAFLPEISISLQKIEAALIEGHLDAGESKRLFHRHKGAAGFLGYSTLMQLLSEMEALMTPLVELQKTDAGTNSPPGSRREAIPGKHPAQTEFAGKQEITKCLALLRPELEMVKAELTWLKS